MNDNNLFHKQFGFRKVHSIDHAVIELSNSIYDNSLKWISSYLSNRKQYTHAGALKTSNLDIICGVSQGSILGPLLFIIYVNDLCNVSKIFEPIIFADDTNISFFAQKLNRTFSYCQLGTR